MESCYILQKTRYSVRRDKVFSTVYTIWQYTMITLCLGRNWMEKHAHKLSREIHAPSNQWILQTYYRLTTVTGSFLFLVGAMQLSFSSEAYHAMFTYSCSFCLFLKVIHRTANLAITEGERGQKLVTVQLNLTTRNGIRQSLVH